MQLVSTEDGYDLMLKHPVGDHIITVARVLNTPAHGPDEAAAFAKVLAAAFLLLHVVNDVVEYIQPDGWQDDSDEAPTWRAAIRALLVAEGNQIPDMLMEKSHPAHY
jgi:hypothetical protein